MRWLPTRAHDNGMFIVYSNGVGEDDGEVRTGNAMLIDCYGRIINETTSPEDTMVVADLDLSLLELCTGRRWMKGRRPELYGKIAEATGAELNIRNVRFDDKP
jgi:predicted amidohydrolase